jgi:hypothetical protein
MVFWAVVGSVLKAHGARAWNLRMPKEPVDSGQASHTQHYIQESHQAKREPKPDHWRGDRLLSTKDLSQATNARSWASTTE